MIVCVFLSSKNQWYFWEAHFSQLSFKRPKTIQRLFQKYRLIGIWLEEREKRMFRKDKCSQRKQGNQKLEIEKVDFYKEQNALNFW